MIRPSSAADSQSVRADVLPVAVARRWSISGAAPAFHAASAGRRDRGVRKQPRLVLDLHHHDRAVGVGIDQVADQRLESLGIGPRSSG